jgi:hypothetical protein
MLSSSGKFVLGQLEAQFSGRLEKRHDYPGPVSLSYHGSTVSKTLLKFHIFSVSS